MKQKPPSARLYAILARNSPAAVIFRRGPSKRVLLIKWNTDDDTFEYGQWLHGRIYERRCDLSHDGHLLIYFAGNYRNPVRTWTAISRPPWLTALAFWPKGDAWGGGGHWVSPTRIELNHRSGERTLTEGTTIPRWLKVKPFGDRPGWGEDDPIWPQRLERDGWKLVSVPERTKDDFGAKVWLEFDPPYAWRKPHAVWPKKYSLEMSIMGIKERDGPGYITEHAVIRENGEKDKIGRSDWADWSHSGDLLFSIDGCLFRLPCHKGKLGPLEEAWKIADFSGLRFEQRKAPEEAQRWPARRDH